MTEPLIIGLTGPTGSGKSTVAQSLEEAGCVVIDADKIAREVVAPGAPALKELQREFGDTILDDYGNLRRHTLANLAFSSLEKTKRLNEITHPHILRKMKENIEECRQKRKKVVVLDAPLLFEAGLERICTVTLAVLAPREQRLQRVMARDSITREEAEKRMSAQQQDQYYKDGRITCWSIRRPAARFITKPGDFYSVSGRSTMSKTAKKGLLALLLLAVLAVAAAGAYFSYSFFMKQAYPLKYRDIIETQAEKYSIDPAFLYGMIRTESNFNPDAESSAGARGLMQIMPATFDWLQTHKGTEPKLDASALYDPQVNVEYGVYFLSILWEEYDDETVILSAYNAGMGNVDQWLSEEEHSSDGVTLHDIPYGETEQYVKNVLESQEMYRRLYGEEFKNWR